MAGAAIVLVITSFCSDMGLEAMQDYMRALNIEVRNPLLFFGHQFLGWVIHVRSYCELLRVQSDLRKITVRVYIGCG